ncbi:MAG: carbamate kinase [Acholeplasmataceae bacterium]
MARYVISLGGNALGNTPEEQKNLLNHVAEAIFPLIEAHHDICLIHGNGPQVGMINLAFTEATSVPNMPFAECGAMSQGYIGYHIQNAFNQLFKKHRLDKQIATIVTQVLVDHNDQAFLNPTKPIGTFYTKEQANEIEKMYGYTMKEDAGRGYRRVVASPKPIDVIEKESILALLDQHHIVIASGGGGIPVILKDQHLVGVDAVIDKDFASAKMAEIIDADALIILTAVDHVYLNFNQDNQETLKHVTLKELEGYLAKNHFKEGSMRPKIEACMSFTRHTKKQSVIASLDQASLALKGESGTIISFE